MNKQISYLIEIAELAMTRQPAMEALRLEILDLADSEKVDRKAINRTKRILLDAIEEYIVLHEKYMHRCRLEGMSEEHIAQFNQVYRLNHFKVLQLSLNGTLSRIIAQG